MITSINEFKKIHESNQSQYFTVRYVDGQELLYGSNCIISATIIDSPGQRVDFTLDNGFFIRISDDHTIYILINGDATECRFDEYDTSIIIDYIYQADDLYDYPRYKDMCVDVLNALMIESQK